MKLKLYLMMLILLSFCSYAYMSYEGVGKYDYASDESGLWNGNALDISSSGIELTDPQSMVLTDDVDNDGNLEYIVLDDGELKIFSGETSLSLETSLTLSSTRSNIFIQDIDGNGDDDIIIFITSNRSISFFEWDGVSLAESNSDYSSFFPSINDAMLACDPLTDRCLGVVEMTHNTTAFLFDKTVFYNQLTLEYNANYYNCLPRGKGIAVDNWDNVGNNEYGVVLSMVGTGTEAVSINILTDAAGILFRSKYLQDGDPEDYGSTNSCQALLTAQTGAYGAQYGVSNPIFINFEGDAKKELLYAYCYDCRTLGVGAPVQKFRMSYMKSDGTQGDRYPEVLFFTGESEGIMLSNVFAVDDAFLDSSLTDACVIGYAPFTQKMTLLCASESAGIDDNFENELDTDFNLSGITDMTVVSEYPDILVHTLETKSEVANRKELLTSYGIIQFTSYDITKIYETPYGGILLPISDDSNSQNDLIDMTDNALWYIDDGLSNTACTEPGINCLTDLEICADIIDNIGKINETLRIRPTFQDVDGDIISYNITLYFGDGNHQEIHNRNISSGYTDTIISLKINKTTTNGIIHFEFWDIENPQEVDTFEEIFVIQEDGLSYSAETCYYLFNQLDENLDSPSDINIGDTCDSGDECDSGYCEYNICSLKPGGYECNMDAECLSELCKNGECTKPSLFQTVESAKNQQVGSDSNTNNLISLIIMVGVTIAIIWGSKGHIAGIVVSGLAFNGLGFFFLLVSWLSPFIMFGIFALELVVLVLAIIVSGVG